MSETIGQFFPVDSKHWWHVALRGFLALLFGILLFAWPGIAMFIFAIVFGAYVFVDGIFTLVAAINYKAGAGKRYWLFVRGIFGIIVGIVTFFWPAITEIALVLLIGAWALIAGIMELNFAFRAVKNTGIKWLFAISGILAVILGMLLLIRPIAAIIAVIWVIAAYAVIAGILLLIVGFRLRSQKS